VSVPPAAPSSTSLGPSPEPEDREPASAPLAALAADLGVQVAYTDASNRAVTVATGPLVAVLGALGVDAGSPESVAAARDDAARATWARVLAPVVAARAGVPTPVLVRVPDTGVAPTVWVELADGTRTSVSEDPRVVDTGQLDGQRLAAWQLVLPDSLPTGWHHLHVAAGGGRPAARADLVVGPARLGLPPALAGRRVWGVMAQLYQVRSAGSWGVGDLADLADLARWSAGLGADFVLVNPLHAAAPVVPQEPSPYLPASREFLHPLYLRVEHVAEYADLAPAARAEAEAARAALAAQVAAGALVDRDAAWATKSAVLERVAALPRSAERQGAYDAFLAEQGRPLVTYATWCALAERHGADFHAWPEDVGSPDAPGVGAAAAALADRVAFHAWLQWCCAEQLAGAQAAATAAGMAIGVLADLAVGVHPGGADAWAQQGTLAAAASLGSPPDPFNLAGQDWSARPWDPRALAEAGYAPFRRMLATVLRGTGGVRVDHILGLFRLWWVPAGHPAADGAYVASDHEALTTILALAAQEAGAVVVGEDLGTVGPDVRGYLTERGVAGTSVLWFERDTDGAPVPAPDWRALCLATVTTHDLPPTAAYVVGGHLAVRAQLGMLGSSLEQETAAWAGDLAVWRDRLVADGLADPAAVADGAPGAVDAMVTALHRFVASTPARLVGVALVDLVGDRVAQNMPGTYTEYPNWRVPLTGPDGAVVWLEDLPGLVRASRLAEAVRAAMAGPRTGPSEVR